MWNIIQKVMQKARWRTASSDGCWLDFNCSAGKVVALSHYAGWEKGVCIFMNISVGSKISMLHLSPMHTPHQGNNAALNKWTTPVTNWNNNTQDHVPQIIKQQPPLLIIHTQSTFYPRYIHVHTFIWGTHSFTGARFILPLYEYFLWVASLCM